MTKLSSIRALSIVASSVLGLAVLSIGTVSAAPLANTVFSTTVEKTNVITKVRSRRSRRRNRNLFLGLGAAAFAGAVIANNNRYYAALRVRYYTPPVRYYTPRVRYSGGSGYRAWSPGWYRYCQARFRSFNPNTGYYRSYNNGLQFCYLHTSFVAVLGSCRNDNGQHCYAGRFLV